MAGSSLQSSLIMALQQQLISNILDGNQGNSLVDALLRPQQKTGRQIAALALTGRIRSDAGLLRQASRNVSEGAAIADTISEASSSALKSLDELKTTVANAQSTNDYGLAFQLNYNSAVNQLKSAVTGAAYNGISLMDNTNWERDDRLTVAADEKTATLQIQSGTSSKPLTLTDFSSFANALPGAGTINAANAQEVLDQIASTAASIGILDKNYSSLASSLGAEAKSLDRQAGLLKTTAARAIAGAGDSPADKLLYHILSNHGKIINNAP